MSKKANLGIWMDHASAHLMEYPADPIKTIVIDSSFTHQEREHALTKGERHMHNKEQREQSEYYDKLAEVIKNYGAVIIFGPTDAKTELLNVLKGDHHFDDITIDIKQSDKMTENQEHAFVRDHFSNVT